MCCGQRWQAVPRPRLPPRLREETETLYVVHSHLLTRLSHHKTLAWKMGAAERGELTEADREEEAGRGEGADRDSEEISGGTFPKCRMTLPITTCREVERVSSCTISPQLACRAITTGTYTSHPTPSLNATTIIILQFREISQQSCESSLRVIGLFCIWSLGLWEAHGAQGDE